MKNIFDPAVVAELTNRINKLSPDKPALWGTMNAAQMLAHCNVAYELIYEDKHPEPGLLKKWILKLFVKKIVVGEKGYKQNSPTGPQFIVKDERDFHEERNRLLAFLHRTSELGVAHFHGKESVSFGKLSGDEWNNMFYKHIEHHLSQFGV